MRIIHTSDWHLGNRLMEQSRHHEFAAFLDWLLATMKEQRADALLVCGDVFDSTTPSDKARELYCDFLSRADGTGCRATVITGANHDSVQQLRVAAPLLGRHHACVVPGLKLEDAADCLIPLLDAEGREAALVAAVPFLRTDIARRVAGDDEAARRSAYVDGIADCYAAVAAAAKAWKAADASRAALPVIAMGHLSVSGASATASTRPAVIGTVESVSCGIFDPVFDYVALGHIHRPSVHADGRVRYCGSPLPMGFDEAAQPHELLLLDIEPGRCEVTPIPVPRFALYEEARCASRAELAELTARLKRESEAVEGEPLPVMLKLHYSGGDQSQRELNAGLNDVAADCHLQGFRTLRAEVPQAGAATALPEAGAGSLHELSPQQLFERRFDEWSQGLEAPPSDEDRAMLTGLFTQILHDAEASLPTSTPNA